MIVDTTVSDSIRLRASFGVSFRRLYRKRNQLYRVNFLMNQMTSLDRLIKSVAASEEIPKEVMKNTLS